MIEKHQIPLNAAASVHIFLMKSSLRMLLSQQVNKKKAIQLFFHFV